MAFNFDKLKKMDTFNDEILNYFINAYTDAITAGDGGIDRHQFLLNEGCFSAKKGFYLKNIWPDESHSGEYYIEDPNYYLKKEDKLIPEVLNFSIVYLEPDRQDLTKPLSGLYISDKDLEYPALVFQQLNGEINPDGVFPSTDSKLNKKCFIFLGIFKIDKIKEDSISTKYKFIKIGDTFYFDSSKK